MDDVSFTPDEEIRLIAQAIGYLYQRVDDKKPLPPEISSYLGVRSSNGPSTLANFTNKVLSTLRHFDDPESRQVLARLGAIIAPRIEAPVPDEQFENLFARYARPNVGLVLEFLIGLEHPGASAIRAHDPRELGDIALKLSRDGDHISIVPVAGGRRLRRKAWTVVSDLLLGRFVLTDPQGCRLESSDGIGSLHAPFPAAWRNGPGPAARFSLDEMIEFIKSRASRVSRSGRHLPAVLAVSTDGWFHASRMADVPGENDAAKFAVILRRLSRLDVSLVCLMDSTGSGWGTHPLLGFASTGYAEVLDLGAEHRRMQTSSLGYVPGHDTSWTTGLQEGAAISRARAEAFVEMAGKMLA